MRTVRQARRAHREHRALRAALARQARPGPREEAVLLEAMARMENQVLPDRPDLPDRKAPLVHRVLLARWDRLVLKVLGG